MVSRRFPPLHPFLLAAACSLLALGCPASGGGDDGGPTEAQLDSQLRSLIALEGLTGRPELIAEANGIAIPDVSDPLVQLGMRLFFTKSLGGDFTVSCASCHHPLLGGGDGLTLSIGVDTVDPDLLGPGRTQRSDAVGYDGGPNVPRNAPTTFNVALWKDALFWDGRVRRNPNGSGIITPDSAGPTASDPQAGNSLATAQARFPVTSNEEMRSHTFEVGADNDTVRAHLAGRIGDYGLGAGEITEDWLPLFREAFDDPTGTAEELIHYGTIAEAIAAYEHSQFFVDNPWNRYVLGDDDALTPAQKRGALLFFRSPEAGGAGCVGCHSGDFFTDERYHDIAMIQVGRGKGDLNGSGAPTQDWGRRRTSGDPSDTYAFRTPTLLNVEVTGPYGHSGAYSTLEGVIRHHLDPVAALASYDTAQLDPGVQTADLIENTQEALDLLLASQAVGASMLPTGIELTEAEIADLVAFLEALTDPRVEDPVALEPWIPRNDSSFVDSQLLDARFE